MAYRSRCLRPEDYRIGWIAALPLELDAAVRVLDERHFPPSRDILDMVYEFGEINGHNIVIACLPAGQYGTNSAASVAASMRARFPNLLFCLLVGIGGGVASPGHDVRLGDVVVSQPSHTSGGVVQYDQGKNTSTGFQRTGSLNSPPDFLLRLLSLYQSLNRDEAQTNGPSAHVFSARVTKALIPDVPDEDLLFDADYDHVGGETCQACSREKCVQRQSRKIMIHYGTIASGNQVIKDARTRDQLSHELGGVLCFEMEAAGVMNALPCLVVRGICDYADSHKSKNWQPYAAIVSAAYCKELLSISAESQENGWSGSRALSRVSSYQHSRKIPKSPSIVGNWGTSSQDVIAQDFFTKQHISDYDAERTLSRYLHSRCPDTTLWVLDHPQYLKWQAGNAACLWITGKRGCGKTLVTSTIIDQLIRESEEENKPQAILHYFFSRSYKHGLNFLGLIRSLLQQILKFLEQHAIEYPSEIDHDIRHMFGLNSSRPNFEDVEDLVFTLLAPLSCMITVVIDGLDGCEELRNGEKSRNLTMKFVNRLLRRTAAKILISSRESIDVTRSVHGSMTLAISTLLTTKDIDIFVNSRLQEKMLERCITDNAKVLDDIRKTLTEKADGMILWVELQIDCIWDDCFGDTEIHKALTNIPKGLEEAYRRCIEKIESRQGIYSRGYGIRILAWVCTAQSPLSVRVAQEALAIDPVSGTLDHQLLPSVQDTLRSCANLVALEERENEEGEDSRHIVLVHHSLYQYLPKASGLFVVAPERATSVCWQRESLAGICIRHLLSKDYSLSIQRSTSPTTLQVDKSMPEHILRQLPKATTGIGQLMSSFSLQYGLFSSRKAHGNLGTVTVSLPSRTRQQPTLELPAFFYYARDEWPFLAKSSVIVEKLGGLFEQLALQPNPVYEMHPWQSLGISSSSHLAGMFTWSFINNHAPMYEIGRQAMSSGGDAFRNVILSIPIPQYGGSNAVALIMRRNRERTLLTECSSGGLHLEKLVAAEDVNGWNGVHHAAAEGSFQCLELLKNNPMAKIKLPYERILIDGHPSTPFTIAAKKGFIEILLLLSTLPNLYEESMRLPEDQKIYCDTLVPIYEMYHVQKHAFEPELGNKMLGILQKSIYFNWKTISPLLKSGSLA